MAPTTLGETTEAGSAEFSCAPFRAIRGGKDHYPLSSCGVEPARQHTHFWLEMRTLGDHVTALCQGCKQRGDFSMFDWAALAVAGRAKNKPVRL